VKLKKVKQEKEIAVLKAWMNGEERERNRISQELHDGVAAMLGAAKLNLQSIPYLTEEKKQVQYDKIASILDNTHSDVRRIAHNLLPITLQQEGLIAAIQQFANDLNITGIIEMTIIDELHSELMLNKQTQLMLFRIIQELANNIIKHAQASKASILFTNDKETLTVKVSDNGKGFSAIANQDSQGLFSIRERLKSLGGVFDIDSKEGSGTSAVLHISLQKNP
jgi:signal transduction histidine kinase